ncbi:hypothetical protein AB0I81_44855 [Nonomuraea sp. NPDC050404]|uniref:hypothetical protein n=1 Tax=Nonomuraea sp. NPDC050404 TaxID=3155783 RepID=UPI0033FF0F1E
MIRRHRLGVPALFATCLYLAALAVGLAIALATGDLGVLWWVALFAAPDDAVQATPPNVLLLTLAGLVIAWGVWQCLRGPLTGPPVELDRNSRWLRVALYVSAATYLLNPFLTALPPWGAMVTLVPMLGVVLLFSAVLGRSRGHTVITIGFGVLGHAGGIITLTIALIVAEGEPLIMVSGLAALIWIVLILRAQWDDDRWQESTVKYGALGLLLPILFTMAGALIAAPFEVYDDAVVVAGTLNVIWLARSAHDLAAPRVVPAADAHVLA